MSIDINGIAIDAVNTAWEAADAVLTECTLNIGLIVGAYVPATDAQSKSWRATKPLKVLLYDATKDQKKENAPAPDSSPVGQVKKSAIVRVYDLEGETIGQDDKIQLTETESGIVWQGSLIEKIPTDAIVILGLVR